MVSIKEVDMAALGVSFPEGGVGMVLAQPFLDLDDQPPFACAGDARNRLLACVDATLDVARGCHHGADKTHFTVFPEYTIPGVEGIAKIDDAMAAADWPIGAVVVGGIEGMTPAQFRAFVDMPRVELDADANGLGRLQDHHWVNCCVTWVKLPSGEVRRWVQPKISAAWPERDVSHKSMYCGRSVFVFKGRFGNGRPFRFHSLLCFDWIGTVGDKRVWEWVLSHTNAAASAVDAVLPMTWVFAIQCNDAPCHASFMGQVQPFFNPNTYTSVDRRGTCLVMANVAGKDRPGRVHQYGRSAVIHGPMQFAKGACMGTYSHGGEPYRPGNPLENFSDSIFRESGACIHSFFQVDPTHAPQGVAGRTTALREATVHPFPGLDGPRANGGLVPAATKWLHDVLDEDRSLATMHPAYPLAVASVVPSAATTDALRTLESKAAEHSVRVACVAPSATPDGWDAKESNAVEHMQQTLSLLRLAGHDCHIHGQLAHATVQGDKPFDLVAVRGQTHSQSDKHVEMASVRSRLPLVIVSRDEYNTVWGRDEMTILDTSSSTDEVDITDPRSATRRIGYQTLLDAFRTAGTVAKLSEDIHAVLN